MLYQLNNQVQVIPSVDNLHHAGEEKTWDLRTGQQQQQAPQQKMGLQRIPTKKPGSGIPNNADVAGPTPGEHVGYGSVWQIMWHQIVFFQNI